MSGVARRPHKNTNDGTGETLGKGNHRLILCLLIGMEVFLLIRCIYYLHLSFRMDWTKSIGPGWYVQWGAVFAVCALAALAYANPPFETDDPGVFPQHTGEAYFFSAGDRGSGGVGLDAAPGVEVNYSALPNTFFHLIVPLAYSNPAQGSSAYGLGDVELGFKWRFLSQGHHGIDNPESTGFSVGGGYTLGGPWQVLFSAGRNITNVDGNRFSYYLALFRNF